jgi:hypothetical protein
MDRLNLLQENNLCIRFFGYPDPKGADVYTLTVVVLCIVALSAGWKVSAFELMAQRMVVAINAYREAQGSSPKEMGELSPRYILYLPPPVVVRQGGWCYQESPEGYRRGL